MSNTLEAIQRVIAKRLDMPLEEVAAAQSLADLQIDSLGLIDIIFDVEKALGVNIPDAALKSIEGMEDLVVVVEGLLNPGPAVKHA
jgi:acyl carrier protein